MYRSLLDDGYGRLSAMMLSRRLLCCVIQVVIVAQEAHIARNEGIDVRNATVVFCGTRFAAAFVTYGVGLLPMFVIAL